MVVPALDLTFPADLRLAAELQELSAAVLDGFDSGGLEERSDGWRVYFGSRPERDAARAALGAALGRRGMTIRLLDVPDEDWAARTQAGLRAVRVGSLVIAPPWDMPSPSSSTQIITILPSTGFGTGHHESTRLCLQMMQELPLEGRRVLDVGTGSGVLAIAARRLGAGEVVALDVDPDAIEAARDNLSRNGGCETIQLICADVADADLPRFDVVLANLTGPSLVRLARRLRDLTGAGGTLIVSGFLRDEAVAVDAAFRAFVRAIGRADANGWMAARWEAV